MGIHYTSGRILKKKLGLATLPHVYICKVLNLSAYNFYFVVYDSRRPTMFISNYYVLDKVFPAFIAFHNATKKSHLSPLVDLDKYEGPLNAAHFFVFDLAGRYGNPKNIDFIFERAQGNVFIRPIDRKLDEITLYNLKAPDSASGFTKNRQSMRKRTMHGDENRLSKLIEVDIDREHDWVTFKFLTPATGAPTPTQGGRKGQTNPPSMAVVNNPSKLYEIHIRVLKFFEWLGTKPDATEVTPADVKEILRVADVQLWSNSPSFWWQGMAYMLTQIGASIEPCNIAPRVWNQPMLHGDTYFLDKHTYGLVRQIDFFIPQMASKLTKILRGQGLFGGTE